VASSGHGEGDRPPLRGRAYCGEAHHREWVIGDVRPPDRVELHVGSTVWPYRLVRCPRTGRPAHDHRGALVFVPAPRGRDAAG
jgi:hypothetical protein